MFGKQKEYFTKQYRRRTICSIVLYYITFLSAFRDKDLMMGNTLFKDNNSNTPKLSNYRPFAPHVQVVNQNEIKIKWLPAGIHQKELSIFYELYNDSDLEYLGQDLGHVAKRLQNGNEYKFKLRVCNSMLPDDCSRFSIPRFQKLIDANVNGSSNDVIVFLKLQIKTDSLLLWVLYLFAFFITALVVGVLVLNYLSSTLDGIYFEVTPPTTTIKPTLKQQPKHPMAIQTQNAIDFPTLNNKEKQSMNDKRTDEPAFTNNNSKNKPTCLSDGNLPSSMTTTTTASKRDKEDKDPLQLAEEGWIVKPTKTHHHKKHHRKRNRAHSTEHEVDDDQHPFRAQRSNSDADMNMGATTPTSIPTDTVVVVVDNSNIFIGARETVCSAHAQEQIKPKHVKLRLQQLLSVAENNRRVTRGYTAGSSPPTSEQVWEVYRRHGYLVDLEERRGKDEQRVDEQLHLAIYKALVDFPPQTLVLVTGDGNKGKSRGNTSFVSCATKAIQFGWCVEVLSWKHSLSTEWTKMAARNANRMKIVYLDEHTETLTHIERRTHHKKKSV